MQMLGFLALPGRAEWLVLLVLGGALISAIFYLLTLQTALSRCSPESRALPPGLVWLYLIPLFSIPWNFVLVISVAKSLGNEFRRRGIMESPNPGLALGLAMAICKNSYFIPFVGIWTTVAGYVLWIVYWVTIARYSSQIAAPSIGQLEGYERWG
jgi:hypothetical protein